MLHPNVTEVIQVAKLVHVKQIIHTILFETTNIRLRRINISHVNVLNCRLGIISMKELNVTYIDQALKCFLKSRLS